MPQPTTSTHSGRSLGPLLRPRALGPRALLLIAAAQLSASAEPGVHAVLGGLEARASTELRSLPTGAECYTVSGGLSFLMGISGDYERVESPNRAESPFCGGRSVYKNGEHYLWASDEPSLLTFAVSSGNCTTTVDGECFR